MQLNIGKEAKLLQIFLVSWAAWVVLPILAIACIAWAVSCLFSDSREAKVFAVLPGLILIFVIWGFLWGQQHRLVPVNRTLVVIDRQTGQAVPPFLRPAGITNVPMWTYSGYEYPAQTEYQWCPTFTPSARGGASLRTVFCFTADASKIDWYQQFHAFNGDEGAVTAGWQNAIQKSVAVAVSGFDPRDLTDKRSDVETAVFNQTTTWFNDHGIPVKMVGLKDWRFESDQANADYDKALLSQTQIDIALNEQKAQKIRADTQVLVAKTLADGQRQACQTAGMVSETNCLEYLRLIWLSNSANPANLTVVIGSNVPIAVAPQAAPQTTPPPAPTAQP